MSDNIHPDQLDQTEPTPESTPEWIPRLITSFGQEFYKVAQDLPLALIDATDLTQTVIVEEPTLWMVTGDLGTPRDLKPSPLQREASVGRHRRLFNDETTPEAFLMAMAVTQGLLNPRHGYIASTSDQAAASYVFRVIGDLFDESVDLEKILGTNMDPAVAETPEHALRVLFASYFSHAMTAAAARGVTIGEPTAENGHFRIPTFNMMIVDGVITHDRLPFGLEAFGEPQEIQVENQEGGES